MTLDSLSRFAYDPTDSDERRVEKLSILLVAGICTIAGFLWTAQYLYFLGPGFTAMLPLAFSFIVGTSLVISHLTTNHYYAVYAEIICIIYITALIQWSMGGVFDSGLVMVWAFLGPMVALMFFSFRAAVGWLVLYLINIVITVAFNDYFVSLSAPIPDNVREIFFLLNLPIASIVVFIFSAYFVNAAVTERERANRLLLNILPAPIARRLKAGAATIADGYDEVTVLFADIVDFTTLSSTADPVAVVGLLNGVFSAFDELTDKYGLLKIKTIGDAYMVAGGLPEPTADHAEAVVAFALDILEVVESYQSQDGQPIRLRIGINTGPVVAGVIGRQKFIYDLWGDAVNVASRMESNGLSNQIQVTATVYERLKNQYRFEARDPIYIKGKGMMSTYILLP